MKGIKKTNEEFSNEVRQLHGDDFTFLEPYVNYKTKIKVRHNLCGHEFHTSPMSFLGEKTGCPKCNKKHRRSTQEFIDELHEKYGDEYEVLGEFTGVEKQLLVRHICGHEWNAYPSNLLKSNVCPKCGNKRIGDKLRFSYEDVKEYIESKNYELLSAEYVSARENIMMRCPKGHVFDTTFDNFKRGIRCSVCKASKGEDKIRHFLENQQINFKEQVMFEDLRLIKKLRFDFGVYDENWELSFLLEFDGKQHYEPIPIRGHMTTQKTFERTQITDGMKNKYCEDRNIKLIRIPYWDFKNVEQILDQVI